MPRSRLAVAAVVAACCAAMAVAALGGAAGAVPHAGDPSARTQPPVRPRPTLLAPQPVAPRPIAPQLVAPRLAALPSAAPLPGSASAGSSAPLPGAARACGALPRFSAATAGQIMAGRLTVAPFPAVTIDPNRDGDVNWEINPFGNPTWGQDFRSGGWIEDLVAAYRAGGPQA